MLSFGFQDQVREMLESRNSVDTATQDRSGYVTVFPTKNSYTNYRISSRFIFEYLKFLYL